MNETAPFDPLATPVADYGITDFSLPMAAAVLGLKTPRTLAKRIAAGTVRATGRVKRCLSLDELAMMLARPVTVADYLGALKTLNSRRRAPRAISSTPNVQPNGSPVAVNKASDDGPRTC